MLKAIRYFCSVIFLLVFLSSCRTNTETTNQSGTVLSSGSTVNQASPSSPATSQVRKPTQTKLEIFNQEKIDKNPLLVNDLGGNRLYLMEKSGSILYEYPLNKRMLGNDFQILPDGRILSTLRSINPYLIVGGYGGELRLYSGSEIEWSYELSNSGAILHHDAELLPNGNILTLLWKKIPKQNAKNFGYAMEVDMYPESILEIDPKTDTIVWRWDSMNHVIQETDKRLPNYGKFSENPGKIHLNHAQSQSGMIMHFNGLTYDPKTDLIYVSVYKFSEVWAIDHSTTTEQAKSNTGGKFNRGGQIIYRFGNPSAYGAKGERFLYSSHHPSFTASGTFLIYSNGIEAKPEQSAVYELRLPEELSQNKIPTKAPEILWSYTNPDIYFDKVGGAVIAPNGNVIITEGDGCIWEVTREKEVVWKYCIKPTMFWRTYVYPYGSNELKGLGITK